MKRFHLFFLTVIFSGLLGSVFVAADPNDSIGQIFTNIITFGFLKDWGITNSSIDPIEGFTRFLLFILLFALLFRLAEMSKLGRNTAVAIAIVVSLLTVIFIPGVILLAVGTSYGTLFSLVLLSVPIIFGFWSYFLMKDHLWMRALIMWLLFFLLGLVKDHIGSWASSTHYASVIATVAEWIIFVKWVVFVFAAFTTIQAFASLAKGSEHSDMNLKETAKTFYNWATTGGRRRKTALMNNYIEEEKELNLLDKVEEARDKAVDTINDVIAAGELKNVGEVNAIVNRVEDVHEALEAAKKEYRRVKGKTWRQEQKFAKLRKEFSRKDKNVANLDMLEKQVLKAHEEAITELDTIITGFAAVRNGAGDLKRATAGVSGAIPLTRTSAGPSPGRGLGGGTTLGTMITNRILNPLKALSLNDVKDKQREAIQAVKGIIVEARELMKWKDKLEG